MSVLESVFGTKETAARAIEEIKEHILPEVESALAVLVKSVLDRNIKITGVVLGKDFSLNIEFLEKS